MADQRQYSSLHSIPINLRPSFLEATEVVPDPKNEKQSKPGAIWETIETEDEVLSLPSQTESIRKTPPPTSLEEAEALLNTIPLQSKDFEPIFNLSHAVPTALILRKEEWRMISSTISPFTYANGTGNQNYAIQIKYGLSDSLQISGFYSEADDPLNAQITVLDVRPANLWKVFGTAARWKFFSNTNLSLALNGSLESWTVGSGGNDSRGKTSGDNDTPNIFNDSGRRVETQNFVGSISMPLTWHSNKQLQFTFNPGINFLPPSQGDGQGERVDLGGDYDWKCNLKRSERGVSSKEEENWTRMKIETGARDG